VNFITGIYNLSGDLVFCHGVSTFHTEAQSFSISWRLSAFA